jgi:hypothetical protein
MAVGGMKPGRSPGLHYPVLVVGASLGGQGAKAEAALKPCPLAVVACPPDIVPGAAPTSRAEFGEGSAGSGLSRDDDRGEQKRGKEIIT